MLCRDVQQKFFRISASRLRRTLSGSPQAIAVQIHVFPSTGGCVSAEGHRCTKAANTTEEGDPDQNERHEPLQVGKPKLPEASEIRRTFVFVTARFTLHTVAGWHAGAVTNSVLFEVESDMFATQT